MEKRKLELDLQTAKKWFNGNVQELKDLALKTFPELDISEYIECTEDQEAYFKKGFVYKVLDCKNMHSAKVICNKNTGYEIGDILFVTLKDEEGCYYKNSTKEAYESQAKKQLPKTWEELEEISGFWVSSESKTHSFTCKTFIDTKNLFATKEQAEASIALAQLSQLREVYRDGWKPDWSGNGIKYCIIFEQKKIIINKNTFVHRFLSFQDKETAELFLENFRDLIETAKPLMS